MVEFSPYDSDPEALEWARGKVEAVMAKLQRFERQSAERGDPDLSRQWRKFRNMLAMEFIGGEGCTIARFDRRMPTMVEALSEPRE